MKSYILTETDKTANTVAARNYTSFISQKKYTTYNPHYILIVKHRLYNSYTLNRRYNIHF